jgi:glycosyltransferase involved in cell wall biosynthesis
MRYVKSILKPMRLACVQNGDYTQAAKNFAAGGSETYNGQFYTVAEFQKFAGASSHLVVSIDAPAHEETHDTAVWCGIPEPRPLFKLPRRFVSAQHARKIVRRVAQFQPTHLLVRCLDIIACELFEWANAHGVKTAAIVAARFETTHPACIRFCRAANSPNVEFVGNHNRVATETLVQCGLEPQKAIAWDMPPTVTPDQYPAKRLTAGTPLRLVFAGAVEPDKGVEDFVEAVRLCRGTGQAVQATVFGDGSLLAALKNHPGVAEGWLQMPGRVAQQDVVKCMAAADLVVVPSRRCFNEGLPFVIQEALAVRTPLLLSDHAVFLKYFVDGEAVRFFPEKDPKAMADMIARVAGDGAEYARMSAGTACVWNSLQCPVRFHELLEQLAKTWNQSPARSAAPALVA